MSIVIASESLYPYSLHKTFDEGRPQNVYVDFYSGTPLTKADFEAEDIYHADGSGWIDPDKWDTFVSLQAVGTVRRFAFDNFESFINSEPPRGLKFNFSNIDRSKFESDAHSDNIFAYGTASWFSIRSLSTDGTYQYFGFTGTVSNSAGDGDLKLRSVDLDEDTLIYFTDLVIDLGSLI